MSARLKNLLMLPLLLYLFIYAHSEGDRLPTFLFIVFATLWFLEFLSFLWLRLSTRLAWSLAHDTLEAGSSLTIKLTCRSAVFSFGYLSTCFQLPWNLAGGKSLTSTLLPLPGQHEYALSFAAEPRGHYQIGPPSAQFEDLLGLFRAQVQIGMPKEIWLTPRLFPLKDFPLSPQELEFWGGQQALKGEISSSSRKYQDGDPWQHIHWKATARLQTLMVREPEASPSLKTVLWLDLSSQSYGENQKALEAAISLAASLLSHYSLQNQSLTCYFSSQKPAFYTLPGALPNALKYLAGARADRIQPVEEIPETLPPAGRLILVTNRFNQKLVNRLSGRHGNTCRFLMLLYGAGTDRPLNSLINVRYYGDAY